MDSLRHVRWRYRGWVIHWRGWFGQSALLPADVESLPEFQVTFRVRLSHWNPVSLSLRSQVVDRVSQDTVSHRTFEQSFLARVDAVLDVDVQHEDRRAERIDRASEVVFTPTKHFAMKRAKEP